MVRLNLKNLFKILDILFYLNKNGISPTVEEFLDLLKEKLKTDNPEKICKVVKLMGFIKFELNERNNVVCKLTEEGHKKHQTLKYLFNPDEEQKIRRKKNEMVLAEILEV